jgi:hypothetical protein
MMYIVFLYLISTNGIRLITALIHAESDIYDATLYVGQCSLLEENTEFSDVFILLLNKWIVCSDNISFHTVSKFMCLMSTGQIGYRRIDTILHYGLLLMCVMIALLWLQYSLV